MKDVSVLNETIFSASTENELQERFKDIYQSINMKVNMMIQVQSHFCHFQG